MTLPLPSQLTYGRLRWYVIGLDTDTDLDLNDLPDVVNINGRAWITADVEGDALLGQNLVIPTTILTKATELLIVNGRLMDRAGNTDVKMLANDSPGLSQTGWTYTIRYELDDGYTFGSFSFTLSTDELVDLTREIPLGSPSPGVVELKGPPGSPGEGYGGGFVMGPLDLTSPTAVEIVSRWGVRADGSVYYDANGALPAEAGLLVPDPVTGSFTVFRPGGPFSSPFDVQFSDLIRDDLSASYDALTDRFMPSALSGVNGQYLVLSAGVPTWIDLPVTLAMHDALSARITTAQQGVDGLSTSVSGLQASRATITYVDDAVNAEALARVNADIDLQGQIDTTSGNVAGHEARIVTIESDFTTSVELATAIGDATALFRRYFGKLPSWPAEAVDGDWFYHTTLKCAMMRLDGFWRQITTARYADAAERNAVSSTLLYAGFRARQTDTTVTLEWDGDSWNAVGITPVAAGDTVPGTYFGQYRDHATDGLQRWNGTAWEQALAPTPWVIPLLNNGTGGRPANGWNPLTPGAGGTYKEPAFRREPATNTVRMEGLLATGGSAIIFTLPVGYRPPKATILPGQHGDNGSKALFVQPTGVVECPAPATTTWLSIAGTFSLS